MTETMSYYLTLACLQMKERGMSQGQISAVTGLSRSAIRHRCISGPRNVPAWPYGPEGAPETVVVHMAKVKQEQEKDRTPAFTGWTPELDKKLSDLIALGHSYDVAASQLGLTRSQAIGRANRIGLKSGYQRDKLSPIDETWDQRKRDKIFVKELARAFLRGDHLPAGQPKPLRLMG